MARDCVALMRTLGYECFAVAGHDRGAYVAIRTALDHPQAVTALVVMDAVPIGEALGRCNAKFATGWWHWFFLGQTSKPAEHECPAARRGTRHAIHPWVSHLRCARTGAARLVVRPLG
jgi:pimeloyl-ACP methyl ester carboxylesterase